MEISRLLNQIVQKVRNGLSIHVLLKPNPTVKDFVDKHYKAEWEKEQRKDNYLLDRITTYYQDNLIKDVYSLRIKSWITELEKTKARSTVRRYALLLRTIFNLADELGYLDRDPFDSIKIPPERVENEQYPIPDEALPAIFKQLRQKDDLLFKYSCMLYLTGLRPGDVTQLTYDNVTEIDGIKVIEI